MSDAPPPEELPPDAGEPPPAERQLSARQPSAAALQPQASRLSNAAPAGMQPASRHSSAAHLAPPPASAGASDLAPRAATGQDVQRAPSAAQLAAQSSAAHLAPQQSSSQLAMDAAPAVTASLQRSASHVSQSHADPAAGATAAPTLSRQGSVSQSAAAAVDAGFTQQQQGSALQQPLAPSSRAASAAELQPHGSTAQLATSLGAYNVAQRTPSAGGLTPHAAPPLAPSTGSRAVTASGDPAEPPWTDPLAGADTPDAAMAPMAPYATQDTDLLARLHDAEHRIAGLQKTNESLERLLASAAQGGDTKARALNEELAKRAERIKELEKKVRASVSVAAPVAAAPAAGGAGSAAEQQRLRAQVRAREEEIQQLRNALAQQAAAPAARCDSAQPQPVEPQRAAAASPGSGSNGVAPHPHGLAPPAAGYIPSQSPPAPDHCSPPAAFHHPALAPPSYIAPQVPLGHFHIESEEDARVLARHILAKAQLDSEQTGQPVGSPRRGQPPPPHVDGLTRQLLYDYAAVAPVSPLRVR